MNTLEELMQRVKKRHPKTEVVKKQVSKAVIEDALMQYLQPLYGGSDINRIDIPALTTELVDIKVYKEI